MGLGSVIKNRMQAVNDIIHVCILNRPDVVVIEDGPAFFKDNAFLEQDGFTKPCSSYLFVQSWYERRRESIPYQNGQAWHLPYAWIWKTRRWPVFIAVYVQEEHERLCYNHMLASRYHCTTVPGRIQKFDRAVCIVASSQRTTCNSWNSRMYRLDFDKVVYNMINFALKTRELHVAWWLIWSLTSSATHVSLCSSKVFCTKTFILVYLIMGSLSVSARMWSVVALSSTWPSSENVTGGRTTTNY